VRARRRRLGPRIEGRIHQRLGQVPDSTDLHFDRKIYDKIYFVQTFSDILGQKKFGHFFTEKEFSAINFIPPMA
jgi:hypothetical protein